MFPLQAHAASHMNPSPSQKQGSGNTMVSRSPLFLIQARTKAKNVTKCRKNVTNRRHFTDIIFYIQ